MCSCSESQRLVAVVLAFIAAATASFHASYLVALPNRLFASAADLRQQARQAHRRIERGKHPQGPVARPRTILSLRVNSEVGKIAFRPHVDPQSDCAR